MICAIPTTGSGGYFFPIQRVNKKNNSLPKHRLVSTQKSGLGIVHVSKKKKYAASSHRMSPRRELSAGKQPVLHVLPKKCISHPDTHSSVHPLPLSRASAGIHFPWTFYKCLSRASHSHSLTMALTAILFLLRVSKGAREK